MIYAIQNPERTNEALRTIRQQQRRTLRDVATGAGISVSGVYRTERNSNLVSPQLMRVAAALGCRVEVRLIKD